MHFPQVFFRTHRASPPSGSPAATEADQGDGARRRRKIADFFERLEQADGKRADPAATRVYIQTRLKLQEKKVELRQARTADTTDRVRIRQLEKEVQLLKSDQQKLYVAGPQGLSAAELEPKRKEQRKAAWIEGMHTLFGARLLTSAAGIAGVEVAGAGKKTAIHQALGYGPQSMFSGLLRIVTELPQMRMNKGGKPKMPPNLAITSDFKRNNEALQAARTNVKAARDSVAAAIQTVLEGAAEPEREAREALARELEAFWRAVDSGNQYAGIDENLWILLEREFRGKKASAIVAVLAGLASTGAYAVDPTGAGAVAAHKLLCLLGSMLQLPASVPDYLDGNVDFPQKISAKKIDLSLLLKPGRSHKDLKDIEDDDIDTTIAVKLYDEQPQLVRETIRAISVHALGELNAKRLALREQIENDRYPSLVPPGLRCASVDARRRQKLEQLRGIELEFQKLQAQHVLFEQHSHDQIDPEGLIGRAIVDPAYFCLKGIGAGVFNKMGELLSQVNQRINNYLNPLLGIGLASSAIDGATSLVGDHFVQDAIHSFKGDGPENTAAENATIAVASLGAAGAVNCGVTVGPARFNKTAHDRKALGSPAYISNGKAIDAANRQGQAEQAFRNGTLSRKQKKKLDEAISVLAAAENADVLPPSAAKSARMQGRWDRFEALRDTVNKTMQEIAALWIFPQYDAAGKPLLDHQGKPIVIDARTTAACHGHYISAWKRALVLALSIPKSMYQSMRFWKDIAVSRQEKNKWRKLVADGGIADQELAALVDRAGRMLRPAPKINMEIGEPDEAAPFSNDVLTTLAHNGAAKIRNLTELPIWAQPAVDLHANLERIEIREQIDAACATLGQTAAADLALMDEPGRTVVLESLERLGTQVRALHEAISRINADTQAQGASVPTLYQYRRLMGLAFKLEESMVHIDSLRSSFFESELIQNQA